MSAALDEWRDARRVRLDRLTEAHRATGPTGTRVSQYLNWALLMAVTREFQGFSRDLHDLAAATFVAAASPPNVNVAAVIRARLTDNRVIDTGNPRPEALGADFGRFGLSLWATLNRRHPDNGWERSVGTLIDARNAVAHGDMARLAAVRSSGYAFSVKTITRSRRDLDALAGAMDDCVAQHHATLFDVARPW